MSIIKDNGLKDNEHGLYWNVKGVEGLLRLVNSNNASQVFWTLTQVQLFKESELTIVFCVFVIEFGRPPFSVLRAQTNVSFCHNASLRPLQTIRLLRSRPPFSTLLGRILHMKQCNLLKCMLNLRCTCTTPHPLSFFIIMAGYQSSSSEKLA